MKWDPSKRTNRSSGASYAQGVRVDKRIAYEKYEKTGEKNYNIPTKTSSGAIRNISKKYNTYRGVGRQVVLQILSGKVPLIKTKK